ncbi:MAG TPA: hypothetical protein VJR89_04320, partial [Polyangiales bacterium]|nr:hypothetical protein [Polyangiales bacterium]
DSSLLAQQLRTERGIEGHRFPLRARAVSGCRSHSLKRCASSIIASDVVRLLHAKVSNVRILLGLFLTTAAVAALSAAPIARAQQAAPAPAQPPAAGAATPAAAKVPPEPVSENARITFVTNPPAHATVSWGKVRLGVITPKQALVVVRPRDSGPLDVVVRAPGYMQVTTRAHTFGDSRIVVKLTTLEQKSTLLGYKAPIDAGLPDAGDGLPPADAITAPPLP